MNTVINKLIEAYPCLLQIKDNIEKALTLLLDCCKSNGTVMVCGNGGSAADSEHIVGELMKGFNLKRPLTQQEKSLFDAVDGGAEIASKLQRSIRAISLVSQTGLISAFANDVDASLVYAQQVFAYAQKPCDLLIALSTSGNSVNVVNAVKAAKATGIKCVAITSENGGLLDSICNATIKLPAKETFYVQELTLPVYHALCAAAEQEMFG